MKKQIMVVLLLLLITTAILPVQGSIKKNSNIVENNLEYSDVNNKIIELFTGFSYELKLNYFLNTLNDGAIWTTLDDCGEYQQNVNHFFAGDDVYVNGENFDPDTDYFWNVEGTPNSCDLNIIVANGIINTDSYGKFCFLAYTVQYDDCGVYHINVGNKNDNFQVVTFENDPPLIFNPNPPNGANNQPITISELSVTIEDQEGDTFDWSIETSPNIGSNSGTGEVNGTKTCIISGLEYSTTYNWYVNASDIGGSGNTTQFVYSFTTISSNPPVISNPDPFNGSSEVAINLTEISVTIEDPEGDNFDWSIVTDPNIGSASGSGESNGTKTCDVSGLLYSTTYTWTVTANDVGGSGESIVEIYTFTTITNNPLVISDPDPDDGIIGVSISLSELSVTIEDPEGDSFDWTIETSPDIGNSGAYNEYNGVKTCSVSGLNYNTTYTWFVNASESGSGQITGEIYTFTTESEGNDRPVFSDPNPPNSATLIPITLSELNVTIEDPEYDRFNWNIETSPNIGNSSGNWEHDGIKTCSISGLEYEKTYIWKVEATDPIGSGKTRRRYYIFYTQSKPPNIPSLPEGPLNLDVNKPGNFCTQTSHPDGIKVQYRFDWDAEDSHVYSYWTNFVSSGTKICVEHSWNKAGTYVVKSIARDEKGVTSKWSNGITIIIGNHPPEKPETPWKKTRAPKSLTFCTKTNDPDGDQIWYWWDWGDGTNSNWLGPYNSGETFCTSHSWNENGDYKIKVKAKDIYNIESEWSETTHISLIRAKIKNQHLISLFGRYIYLFPILKMLFLR